jgi:CheY-like chemotaxis protein
MGGDVKVSARLDDGLSMVLMDAGGFESALLNLVVNARDAMPNGGSLTISTQLTVLDEDHPLVLAGELKAGSYASVSVSDTGHGMSKETLERVFEPFFTTKPRGKGTGLGLAMVYGFVKQSGGAVRVYSEPGYGTAVTFYLRLAKDAATPVAAAMAAPARRKRGGKVLVVDDNQELVEIAMAYLAEMGYTAYQAADGASALAVVEEHRDIDLMVTDIIMPGGMNGAELARKVREALPNIKIVYSSGFPADTLAERSMPLVDGYLLYKPYQLSEFGAAIRQALE